MTPDLEVIIGLEVHAQMSTKTKMFCGCDNDAFGKAPNTTVCPICMGHPGTLPAPNAVAIEKAMKASLALKCTINKENHFDRKHYFYPDLPMGFQISQYDFPLSSSGSVVYDIIDDSGKVSDTKTCGITRLHMENDAGKLTHKGTITLCDYNRAGTPLMEIVTEPDLRSEQEAVAFAQELRRILIAVNASEADMFKGMMRFDASISLREKGTEKLNPRSEIKNLNSFKALERALQYEEKRLRKEWEDNNGPREGDITVGWQDDIGKTRLLREKETADDYRYFPEPDIPPLTFTQKDIDKVSATLPKLPREQKEEYMQMGIDEKQALQLVDQSDLRSIFDAVYNTTKDAKRTSSLVLMQLLGFLNTEEKEIVDGPNAEAILELVSKIDDGTISANAGKDVLQKMVETGKSATIIIEEEGMQQISDNGAIEEMVQKAIDSNPKAIEDFKNGNEKALGAIVGFVMKESKGQANPGKVNEILKKKL
ncbi:Asp-tRNA(Asn)/Glu-tRNA(Gln) amidotransferase GatCAB subunit B [Candidatus Peregrinibacteria bacterium CG10_big_fil_rev_8_21_14_0_10_42_8]|nr:MAG: Asp-tRNA(Asn)/Glu-tRNA(Gln) amidotransferase GatCAB subunit B [Candidatus Peregrinibacteria bacterium CG10_big_fil_rev_8_21_14_0_10_42_8]